MPVNDEKYFYDLPLDSSSRPWQYNKSTMPVNDEKYFYDLPLDSSSRPWQHCLTLHYPSSLPTALSRQPKKDCSNSADIGIG